MYRASSPSYALPMHHVATVHVLGPTGGSAAALCRGLKLKVDARLWTAVPPAHKVRPGDLVVIDLTDRHASLEPRGLQPLLGRVTLCLIPGDTPINPHWLDIASQPGVQVLSASSRRFGHVTAAELLLPVQGTNGRRGAGFVLNVEPAPP